MPIDPEAFFRGHPMPLAVFERVRADIGRIGAATIRTGRSQVAFRRRRGFAYLWLPGRWLKNPAAEVVLSIALDRHDESPRWKQVAHPAPRVWMHHLEIQSTDEIDEEVEDWLRSAFEQAG